MNLICSKDEAQPLGRGFFGFEIGTGAEKQNPRPSRWAPYVLSIALLAIASTARADDAEPADAPKPSPSLMKWLAAGGPSNPMEATRLHAAVAAGGLTDDETGKTVQEKQKQVVAGLDAMIKQLEEEERKKKMGNGPGGPNPTKPATKSTLAKGPGGSGPLHENRGGIGGMGKLDDKQREQIQQSQTQGFPAGYDSVLSNYYTRLAQEQASQQAPAAAPTAPALAPADAKTTPPPVETPAPAPSH